MIFGVEIACFSLQAVQLAQQFGADRVEFCADKSAGGITPPRAEIIQAKKFFDIPLFVMIRPHGGDFIYDNSAYQ
ncbi:MAG: copper homeostasis protein CutC, partial [Saprospiraceae bacterium]